MYLKTLGLASCNVALKFLLNPRCINSALRVHFIRKQIYFFTSIDSTYTSNFIANGCLLNPLIFLLILMTSYGHALCQKGASTYDLPVWPMALAPLLQFACRERDNIKQIKLNFSFFFVKVISGACA